MMKLLQEYTHIHGTSSKRKNNFIIKSYTLVNKSVVSLYSQKIKNQKIEESFKKCV